MEEDATLEWTDSINWDEACRCCQASESRSVPCIVLTSAPFSDNWFSHGDGHFAIVSTHQWFDLLGPPSLQSYLLHEFALHAAKRTIGLSGPILRYHENATGCIFDFCSYKPDILMGLYAGYICGSHKELLRQLGITADQLKSLENVLNVMRAYALGRDEEKRRFGAFTQDKVFIVHGRDITALRRLDSFLTELGLEPVGIIDEPVGGIRTVIERIEEHSNVGFAFVIITPDDEGRLVGNPTLEKRPLQNVIFELGLFCRASGA